MQDWMDTATRDFGLQVGSLKEEVKANQASSSGAAPVTGEFVIFAGSWAKPCGLEDRAPSHCAERADGSARRPEDSDAIGAAALPGHGRPHAAAVAGHV